MEIPKDPSYDELCVFFTNYLPFMDSCQKKLLERFKKIQFTRDDLFVYVYTSGKITEQSLSIYNYLLLELIVYHIRFAQCNDEFKELLKQILIMNYNNIQYDMKDYIINAPEIYTFFKENHLIKYYNVKYICELILGEKEKTLWRLKFMLFKMKFFSILWI